VSLDCDMLVVFSRSIILTLAWVARDQE